MPYWYIARSNELMIDIDHKDMKRPPIRLLSARSRLKGAISEGILQVQDSWLFPSDHPKHYHMIVRLHGPEEPLIRLAWEGYLRDDPFRLLNNMRRLSSDGAIGSLLITSESYKGFYRNPDYACKCKSKHSREVMSQCPIGKTLRNTPYHNTDFFGKPESPTEPISFGRMYV